MKLGVQVGLGFGHIVLYGDPVFGPYSLWPNGWIDQDATWYEGTCRFRPTPHCAIQPLPGGLVDRRFRHLSSVVTWSAVISSLLAGRRCSLANCDAGAAVGLPRISNLGDVRVVNAFA